MEDGYSLRAVPSKPQEKGGRFPERPILGNGNRNTPLLYYLPRGNTHEKNSSCR